MPKNSPVTAVDGVRLSEVTLTNDEAKKLALTLVKRVAVNAAIVVGVTITMSIIANKLAKRDNA